MPTDKRRDEGIEPGRSGRPSASDERTGVEGIQKKGLGGYGADEESVEGGEKKPVTDNAGDPSIRQARDESEEGGDV